MEQQWAWPRRALRSAALLAALIVTRAAAGAAPVDLPEFTHGDAASWLNSAPLKAAELRGKPVLVEFWTFACENCRASLPWMRRIESRYPRLAIIGVHSPELAAERERPQVVAAVQRLGVTYPVMLDVDFSYWRALDNRFWPAFYLYDASGRLVATRVGELHAGEPGADAFEHLIAAQLARSGT